MSIFLPTDKNLIPQTKSKNIKKKFFKMLVVRTGKMAQLAECLLCKHDGSRSDPQHPHEGGRERKEGGVGREGRGGEGKGVEEREGGRERYVAQTWSPSSREAKTGGFLGLASQSIRNSKFQVQ